MRGTGYLVGCCCLSAKVRADEKIEVGVKLYLGKAEKRLPNRSRVNSSTHVQSRQGKFSFHENLEFRFDCLSKEKDIQCRV